MKGTAVPNPTVPSAVASFDMLESYADLLATTDWLSKNLEDPGLRIVDTRKSDGYTSAHIPGAVAIGVSPLLHDAGDVIASDLFADLMSRLGISHDTTIVAYDDGNNLFAARLWWVLNFYGHTKVRVLDGGWDRWAAEGKPIVASRVTPASARFEPRRNAALIADTDYMLASLHNPERQLVDVRADAEWDRTESTGSTVAGHIPGAVHIVWSDVIDSGCHRFRATADLRRKFSEIGLRPDREIIVYCQGGIRAAHTVLALRLV